MIFKQWTILSIIGIFMSLLSAGYALSPKERAAQLSQAELILNLDDLGGQFTLAPDGYTLLIHQGSELIIYDLSKEKPKYIQMINTSKMDFWFLKNKEIWYSTAKGDVCHHTLLDPESKECLTVTFETKLNAIVLSPDGSLLGWYNDAYQRVGLFDMKDMKMIGMWRNASRPLRSSHKSFLFFSPSGKHFIYHRKTKDKFGEYAILNIKKKKIKSTLPKYVSNKTPGYVILGNELYYGTQTKNTLQIRRYNFDNGKDSILDSNARYGHFIDLHASPSGQHIAESDFEKTGVRFYDLKNGEIHKQNVPIEGKHRSLFVGWDKLTDIAFIDSSSLKNDGDVNMEDPHENTHIGSLNFLMGVHVEKMEMSPDGRILVASWWPYGGNDNVRHHIHVYQIPGESK